MCRRYFKKAASLIFGCHVALFSMSAMATDFDVSFNNVTNKLGFVHTSLPFGGGGLAGIAWLDYNNDRLLDIYMLNGKTQNNALFRNNGDGTFTDVATEAGVNNGLGNNGVVVADLNNDGYEDIFLSGEGGELSGESPLRMYINNRNGTFTETSESSGIPNPGSAWSVAMADLDQDSFLDILIAVSGNPRTGLTLPIRVYRNNGDLTFTDVTEQAGIMSAKGSCAIGVSDFDNDGDGDIFVANCTDLDVLTTPIDVFRNDGNWNFTDVTVESGMSEYKGFWMSTNFADYDNDGDLDLFSANTGNKGTMGPPGLNDFTLHGLFENNGDGTFTDVAHEVGVADYEFAWGSSFQDYNNDGYSDIFLGGNFLEPILGIALLGELGNPGRLLMNDMGRAENPTRTFSDNSQALNVDQRNEYTSGVASGDYNNDGFMDILVMATSFQQPGIPYFLENSGNDNNWIGVRLYGRKSNRSAIGAKIIVKTRDLRQVKEIYAGSSFLSSEQKWPTFGLGNRDFAPVIDVVWPSGCTERFLNKGVNKYVDLVEGKGLFTLEGTCKKTDPVIP